MTHSAVAALRLRKSSCISDFPAQLHASQPDSKHIQMGKHL